MANATRNSRAVSILMPAATDMSANVAISHFLHLHNKLKINFFLKKKIVNQLNFIEKKLLKIESPLKQNRLDLIYDH